MSSPRKQCATFISLQPDVIESEYRVQSSNSKKFKNNRHMASSSTIHEPQCKTERQNKRRHSNAETYRTDTSSKTMHEYFLPVVQLADGVKKKSKSNDTTILSSVDEFSLLHKALQAKNEHIKTNCTTNASIPQQLEKNKTMLLECKTCNNKLRSEQDTAILDSAELSTTVNKLTEDMDIRKSIGEKTIQNNLCELDEAMQGMQSLLKVQREQQTHIESLYETAKAKKQKADDQKLSLETLVNTLLDDKICLERKIVEIDKEREEEGNKYNLLQLKYMSILSENDDLQEKYDGLKLEHTRVTSQLDECNTLYEKQSEETKYKDDVLQERDGIIERLGIIVRESDEEKVVLRDECLILKHAVFKSNEDLQASKDYNQQMEKNLSAQLDDYVTICENLSEESKHKDYSLREKDQIILCLRKEKGMSESAMQGNVNMSEYATSELGSVVHDDCVTGEHVPDKYLPLPRCGANCDVSWITAEAVGLNKGVPIKGFYHGNLLFVCKAKEYDRAKQSIRTIFVPPTAGKKFLCQRCMQYSPNSFVHTMHCHYNKYHCCPQTHESNRITPAFLLIDIILDLLDYTVKNFYGPRMVTHKCDFLDPLAPYSIFACQIVLHENAKIAEAVRQERQWVNGTNATRPLLLFELY